MILLVVFLFSPIAPAFAGEGLKEEEIKEAASFLKIKRDPFELVPRLEDHLNSRDTGFKKQENEHAQVTVGGVMGVGKRIMASVQVENFGELTLEPGREIVINRPDASFLSFFVEDISEKGVTLRFSDGDRVFFEYKW